MIQKMLLNALYNVPQPLKNIIVPVHHKLYYLRLWIQRQLSGYGKTTFYSQCSEDWYLAKFFKDQKGMFVDIGAYDGVTHSNSYYLEQQGWKGILVDAIPEFCDRAKNIRTNKVVHAAIVPGNEKEMEFTQSIDQPMFSRIGKSYGKTKKLTVPAMNINELLAKYTQGKTIDLLSMDIEDLDFTVLSTLDFNTFKPKVILVEENSVLEFLKTKELLTQNGYEHHVRTLCNSIYVRKDE